MIQEVVFMLERDVELFIEHCELKGLSKKTIGSYEQTMRLFIRFSTTKNLRNPFGSTPNKFRRFIALSTFNSSLRNP